MSHENKSKQLMMLGLVAALAVFVVASVAIVPFSAFAQEMNPVGISVSHIHANVAPVLVCLPRAQAIDC